MSDRVPNPPLPLAKACWDIRGGFEIREDGTIGGARAIRACDGITHIFAERPGWCQCGQNYWNDDALTSDDIPTSKASA